MRLLAAVYATSSEFLAQYSADYPAGALFVATCATFTLGERVLAEVCFPALPNPTIIRGRVVAAVEPRGAWIACDSADADVLAFVVSMAHGESPAEAGLIRHHARFPARVPVIFRVSEREEISDDIVSETTDLGSGGAFVRDREPPKVGTRVSLRIETTTYRDQADHRDHRDHPDLPDLPDHPDHPGGHGSIEVSGQVAWARPGEGFGVRFDQRGPASAAPLRPLIRRIRETGEVPIWASATAERRDESSQTRIP